jgi:oligopeptide/dipeptide ABC transporter ATP-binding protein
VAESLLSVERLAVQLVIDRRYQHVLHEVSFSLDRREVVALVGESGSGKSMTARAIMNLLPRRAKVDGQVVFDGRNLYDNDSAGWRSFRSTRAAMIFQDPRAAINPVHRLGDFLTEALIRNRGVSKEQALGRAEAVLEEVGIDTPRRRLRQYPHEVSGGMLQRVMIASVLLAEPELILADEPTTALDVTTQSDVVAILNELRQDRGMAMVFITHDLELAAAVSDRIAVMYAGYVVETATPAQLHARPRHPYSAALLASRPQLHERTRRIPQIPGRPLSAFEAPPGCPFQSRCPYAQPRCGEQVPPIAEVGGSLVRCVRADELALDVHGSGMSDRPLEVRPG